MVQRGGTLNAEERQLAKRYAVFFRMPRLSGNSPPDPNRRDRMDSIVSDNPIYSGPTAIPQQQDHTQGNYSTTIDLPAEVEYEASMFDPQNFPQLQQEFYDGSHDIDLGFSDFFGGYAWPPDMSLRPSDSDLRQSPLKTSAKS